MNVTEITKSGLKGARPGREALPGGTRLVAGAARSGRSRRRRRDESVVGDAEFRSYYGRPVIKAPVWEAREIAGYFFLGGLAGASSLIAAGSRLTGRPVLERRAAFAASGAAALSLVALVKDLGRPARFLNMLRVMKPTSPMSVGTWILSGYVPATFAFAAGELGLVPPAVAVPALVASAALGPAVAAYTGALIADTAVPAWHDARRQMPFLFVSSAAAAGAGMGLLVAPDSEAAPLRVLAALGGAGELLFEAVIEHGLHDAVAPAYHDGKAGKLLRSAKVLTATGAFGAAFSGRSRVVRLVSGAALLAGSACTRFGVFHAGVASANDPAATIVPQRERLAEAAGSERP